MTEQLYLDSIGQLDRLAEYCALKGFSVTTEWSCDRIVVFVRLTHNYIPQSRAVRKIAYGM